MTSMNLNSNPLFENFLLSNDPALFAFHEAIIDELFAQNTGEEQQGMDRQQIQGTFTHFRGGDR